MGTRSRASALTLAAILAVALPAGTDAARRGSLSVSPHRAPAGARILVVGGRFPAAARVRLYLGRTRLKTLRASRRGHFRGRVRVPVRRPGLYRIVARTRGMVVRARFRVVGLDGALGVPPPALPPQPQAQPVQPPAGGGSTAGPSTTGGSTTGSTTGASTTGGSTTGESTTGASTAGGSTTGAPPPPPPVTLVAAGDIACALPATQTSTACHHTPVSDRVLALQPDAVETLGDAQYQNGELENYQSVFDPTWGRFKSLIHPVPGNHEYLEQPDHRSATGHFTYFGPAAGDPTRGYYSYTIGSWHAFVLNTGDLGFGVNDCFPVSCAAGSEQEQWLRSELAKLPPDACVVAAFHHPHHASDTPRAHPAELGALYDALYDNGAELLLTGHDHAYERFAQMSDATTVDPSYGVREFVVGTGGRSLYPAPTALASGSEKFDNTHFGVLELVLSQRGYTFRFVAEDGSVQDQGSGSCHGPHP